MLIYFSMGRQHAHNFCTSFHAACTTELHVPSFLSTSVKVSFLSHFERMPFLFFFLALDHVLRINSSSSENHESSQKIQHVDTLSDSSSTYTHAPIKVMC